VKIERFGITWAVGVVVYRCASSLDQHFADKQRTIHDVFLIIGLYRLKRISIAPRILS
jgi:hypothetical protein